MADLQCRGSVWREEKRTFNLSQRHLVNTQGPHHVRIHAWDQHLVSFFGISWDSQALDRDRWRSSCIAAAQAFDIRTFGDHSKHQRTAQDEALAHSSTAVVCPPPTVLVAPPVAPPPVHPPNEDEVWGYDTPPARHVPVTPPDIRIAITLLETRA